MKATKNYVLKNFGIDGPIFWATLNKGLGIIRSPVNIYFLLKYLSVEEQGLWYTFTNLAALSMLADLGFTAIITQFVSHEFANLNLQDKRVVGDDEYINKLFSLIRFATKFYVKVVLVAIAILSIAGLWYFKNDNHGIFIAWVIYSIMGGYGLLVCLFQTIYQGLDKIKEIQIIIMLNSFILTGAICLSLYLHLGIWSLIISAFTGNTIAVIGLYVTGKPFWKQLYHYKIKGKYSFFKEILPLQMRYAISFVCSYLIFFLYVPAAYKFIGPVEAGQLGLTATIVAVINAVANNWIFTKIPKMNMFVSRKEYSELDKLVKKSVIQGLIVQLLFSSLFVIFLLVSNHYQFSFAHRFLSVKLTILFLIPQVVTFIVSVLTLYLRAFKKEPLMWVQVINAILILSAVFIILHGKMGLGLFFYAIIFINWIVILPLCIFMFRKKRVEFIQSFGM